MTNIFKNKIVAGLIYFIEFALLATLVILEYLSGYKAGVMKHIYFKKIEYLSKIYNQSGMMIHAALAVLVCLILFIVFRKQMKEFKKRSFIRLSIYTICLIIAFYTSIIRDYYIYAYLLMYLEILIGVEAIKTGLST